MSSWLLDLTAMALAENPTLSEYTGFVQDSGEGRWTIQAAIDEAVPVDVLSAALYTRFRSRQEHTFAEKMLSAMRQKVRRSHRTRANAKQESRTWPRLSKKIPATHGTEWRNAQRHRQTGRSLRHGDLRRERRSHPPQADSRALQSGEKRVAVARICRDWSGALPHVHRGLPQESLGRHQAIRHRQSGSRHLGMVHSPHALPQRRYGRQESLSSAERLARQGGQRPLHPRQPYVLPGHRGRIFWPGGGTPGGSRP